MEILETEVSLSHQINQIQIPYHQFSLRRHVLQIFHAQDTYDSIFDQEIWEDILNKNVLVCDVYDYLLPDLWRFMLNF